jgi:hypothetical protein
MTNYKHLQRNKQTCSPFAQACKTVHTHQTSTWNQPWHPRPKLNQRRRIDAREGSNWPFHLKLQTNLHNTIFKVTTFVTYNLTRITHQSARHRSDHHKKNSSDKLPWLIPNGIMGRAWPSHSASSAPELPWLTTQWLHQLQTMGVVK